MFVFDNDIKVELNDDELNKVIGGNNEIITKLSDLKIGDVVDIDYSLTSGQHCLVSINTYNTYKFVQYIPGQYVDNAIRFSVIPDGLSMKLVGHDEAFAQMNA